MAVPLAGANVLVAGAGLAGLTAAYDLMTRGANVTVVDARDRPGGRVWTLRNGFAEGQHAEAGGETIDEGHDAIRALCAELGLTLDRALRGGFGQVRPDRTGHPRIVPGRINWDGLARALEPDLQRYQLAEGRLDSPIVSALARRSVADWLDQIHADTELRDTATALRGFFLADPEELSLIAFVEQFAGDISTPSWNMYRIAGGNDRLAEALAVRLGSRLHLLTDLVAVSHRGANVRASLKHQGTVTQVTCDYLVFALPATTLRRVPITPALPAAQHQAIAGLKYGHATKSLLQFAKPTWRLPGRPRAFGSPLPFGAVWDASEHQRGRAGILALLAGGNASDATQAVLTRDGSAGLADSLGWLGVSREHLLAAHHVVWEHDPLVRGGYAYFDPAYDSASRPWLARPCGRLFFAGEHTSLRWQGYMNGAVESGRRAAAEIVATVA